MVSTGSRPVENLVIAVVIDFHWETLCSPA